MGVGAMQQVLDKVILVEAKDGKSQCVNRTLGVLGCRLEHLRIVLHGKQGILTSDTHEGIVIQPQSGSVGIAVLQHHEGSKLRVFLLRTEDFLQHILRGLGICRVLHREVGILLLKEISDVVGEQEEIHLIALRQGFYSGQELIHRSPILLEIERDIHAQVHRRAITRAVDGDAPVVECPEKALQVILSVSGKDLIGTAQLHIEHLIDACHEHVLIGLDRLGNLEACLDGRIQFGKEERLEVVVYLLLPVFNDVSFDVFQHGRSVCAQHDVRCMPHKP